MSDGSECQRDDAREGVCLNGKCQPVGCDNIIASSLRLNQCGRCGEDDRECQKRLFHWKEIDEFSSCDKSCGSNSRQLSISVCINSISGRIVPERMCADQARPRPKIRYCPNIACPAKWWTGAWSLCSRSCDAGTQKRPVYCIENEEEYPVDFNFQHYKIDDQFCFKERKPESVRQCAVEACSKPNTPEKSVLDKVSTSDAYRFAEGSPFSRWNDGFSSDSTIGFSPSKDKDYFSSSDSSNPRRPHFVTGVWSECSKSCGSGIRTRSLECVATQDLTGSQVRLPDFECENQVRPQVFQPCELSPCVETPPKNNGKFKVGAFKWEYGVWGPCSESCNGGKQKSTLKCMDMTRNVAVPWSNCRSKQRPVELTRICNNQPCQPSWRTSTWSECSHICGGGIRSRDVKCVRRVTRDVVSDSANLILPDAQCSDPKPVEQEACALTDCPFTWRIDQWSSCSTSCGPGEQRRSVVCEQRDSQGIVHSFNPPLQCSGLQRPHTLQLCNLGPCNSEYNFIGEVGTNRVVDDIIRLPQALAQQSGQPDDNENRVRSRFDETSNTFDQSQPEHHKITLNIGGFANLYEGTSIKIKCPVRNFARNKITWTKNGVKIKNSAHIKVSSNGALRLFHAKLEDAGLYECFADGNQGNVTLRFKSRDSSSSSKSSVRTPEQEPVDDLEEMKPSDVDQQLVQKVRESLYRLGEHHAFEKLKNVHEPGKLKIDYAIGDWSVCSQMQCGQIDGAQVRLLRCRLMIENILAYVEDEICDAFGVHRPPASRSCHADNCPHWDATEWTDCSMARCLRDGVSISRREVRCQFSNGTVADASLCDRKTRPKTKKECPNSNCTAEWKASIWGKCSKKCGDGGVQMRLLRCVWKSTKKPAGNNCDPTQRPSTIRACAVPDLPKCQVVDPYDEHRSKWAQERQSNNLSGSDLESKALIGKEEERTSEAFASQRPSIQRLASWRGWKTYDLGYWAAKSRPPDMCEDKSRFCSILQLFKLCDDQKSRERCCYSCYMLGLSDSITSI